MSNFKFVCYALAFFLCSQFCYSQTIPTRMNACPYAAPTSSANFCSTFKAVAICHCIENGLPSGTCQNMEVIYNRMIGMFGSVENACRYQRDTPKNVCVDDWNCYRRGGKDSAGSLCNSTGQICQ